MNSCSELTFALSEAKNSRSDKPVSAIEIDRNLLFEMTLPITTERSDGMRIMIVEDSKPVRRMIASFLEDLADEFVECEDGSRALATYTDHRPDIVLMDIKMKHLDGFQATTEIKKVFPAARVFIVSQWDTSELRDLAKQSGADGYVCKKNLIPLRDIVESISRT